MRKILVIAALTAGCASPQKPSKPSLMGPPPQKATIAPHSQARRYQQQEERRAAFEDGAKIEGATVIR